MSILNRRKTQFLVLPAAAAAVMALTACSSFNKKLTDRPVSPVDQNEGYFVDLDSAKERGGVGNYVDRPLQKNRNREPEQNLTQQNEPAPAVVEETGGDDQLAGATFNEDQTDLYFGHDSVELDERARGRLQEVAAYLKSDSRRHVKVDGYANEIGPEAYNQSLSQKRAEVVRDFLVSNGANASQIQYVGHGEVGSVASSSGSAEDVGAKNRRVDLDFS